MKAVDKKIPQRLQKVLANQGLGSRREIERWITEKRITVNDKIACLGLKVFENDQILRDGIALTEKTGSSEASDKFLLYHKSVGEICSRSDKLGRSIVFEQLPLVQSGRWIMVGRLDCNTSGLLLFTTNGLLSHRLLHPSYKIEREYMVRVYGVVTLNTLKRLKEGIILDGHLARFEEITQQKAKKSCNSWYRVILKEGKKREVRRLWESQGVTVSRLKRIRFGPIQLPLSLQPRQYLWLSVKAIEQLKNCVDLV